MTFHRRFVASIFPIFAMAILSSYCVGQAAAVAPFPPLEQWKAAVISGNVAALQALYSSNPPAQVATAAGASNVSSEVAFWTGLKARRLKLNGGSVRLATGRRATLVSSGRVPQQARGREPRRCMSPKVSYGKCMAGSGG